MENQLKFDSLVKSLTNQQQQKSDVENELKRLESEKAKLTNEISNLQAKLEALQESNPELINEIARQNSMKTTLLADIQQRKNSYSKLCETIEGNEVLIRNKAKNLHEETEKNNHFLSEYRETLQNNKNKISAIVGTD